MPDPVRIPLTVFERYMLRDHTADYPMVQLLHAEFHDRLDPELLRKSFEQALRHHPLLTAPIEYSGKRPEWVLSPEPASGERFWTVCDQSHLPQTFTGLIDVVSGKRAFAWHVASGIGSKLVFAADHICCDGIGMTQFIGDWLTIYHKMQLGETIPAPNFSELVAELPRRELPGWRESGQKVSRWQALRGFLRETFNWYARKPQMLAAPDLRHPQLRPCLEYYQRTLSVAETRGLRNYAQAQKATLNDLLLREIFLVLERWNRQHGKSRARDWLRVLMPTSLRGSADKNLSASNRLGYTFLTHRVEECQKPTELLNDLKNETAAIRRWNLGQMFLDGLTLCEKIPGLLSLYTRNKSCLATVVFSNIGDMTRRWSANLPREGKLLRIGETKLKRMSGSPPLRLGTRAVIFANMLNEELTLSGLTDSRHFDSELDRQWWEMLFEQLLATAAEGLKTNTSKNDLVKNAVDH